jgi:site-specific recombinase XerD
MPVHTPVASQEGPSSGLLDTYVESFLSHLRAAGYAERTVRKKRLIADSFVRWTRRKKFAVEDLGDAHVTAFTKRSPRRRKVRVRSELAVLRLFLEYLRREKQVRPPQVQVDHSPAAELHRGYVDYLRNDRGLAENSICVYSPYIRAFLTTLATKSSSAPLRSLDAQTIQDYLLDQTRNRSSEYSRLLAIALRSFCRFLHLRGEIDRDLSYSVPTVKKWGQAVVPASLSPEQVERVLVATDLSTSSGRRDHAILLLLARLGARPGEIVTLELDDIHWRTGEIVVRGKGGMMDHLPLLSEVGEALAFYLRKNRPRSACRRVFLRMWAPPIGLAGPAAVGHIVRRAMARAGIRRAGRGAAHLFRHSLGTTMIRQGASIAEIAEVLRHRTQVTTQIYAKVAFEDLRQVACPWPGEGGVK